MQEQTEARKLLAEALAMLSLLNVAADPDIGQGDVYEAYTQQELVGLTIKIGAKIEQAFKLLGGQKAELIEAQRIEGQREIWKARGTLRRLKKED